jgi:hypothetical protein
MVDENDRREVQAASEEEGGEAVGDQDSENTAEYDFIGQSRLFAILA